MQPERHQHLALNMVRASEPLARRHPSCPNTPGPFVALGWPPPFWRRGVSHACACQRGAGPALESQRGGSVGWVAQKSRHVDPLRYVRQVDRLAFVLDLGVLELGRIDLGQVGELAQRDTQPPLVSESQP